MSQRARGGRNGIALMTTLAVGALLLLLASIALTLYWSERWSYRAQRRGVQALWNAQSGLENYLHTGQVPAPDSSSPSGHGMLTLASGETCAIWEEQGDLIFEGDSGGVRRRLVLVQKDPRRRRELVP